MYPIPNFIQIHTLKFLGMVKIYNFSSCLGYHFGFDCWILLLSSNLYIHCLEMFSLNAFIQSHRVVVIEYMNVLRSSDILSCAPTPILFVAVCGDGIEVGTRSSNSESCSFVVAGNFTSKSSSVG